MSRIITITRRVEWDAAHRVLKHESKCATLHGHHYVGLVTVSAETLDDKDRVIDFGVLKARIGGWVDEQWDHTTLVNKYDHELVDFCLLGTRKGQRAPYCFDGEPTAETIAERLFKVSGELLADTNIEVVSVEVFETPNCSAKITAPQRFSVKAEMPSWRRCRMCGQSATEIINDLPFCAKHAADSKALNGG